MPRRRSRSREALVASAMERFWTHGYGATSMDDLVRATKVSRAGIYGDFGGKRALFKACLALYQEEVVTPAFAQVEAIDADLNAIEAYFEFQLARGEAADLPGPGCLVANTMTEIGPHDGDVLALVRAHNDRLRHGFLRALRRENAAGALPEDELERLASFLVTSAQGLWSYSRSVDTVAPLRDYARTLMALIRARLAG